MIAVMGIPLVLVALFAMFGRFIIDAKQRSRTHYGVTDRRVIIISGLIGREVKTLNLRTLSDITLIEKASGMGTIIFGSAYPVVLWRPPCSGTYAMPIFELIDDAKLVYEKILEAQAASR